MGSVLETGDGDQSYSIFFAFVWYVLQWVENALICSYMLS